MTIIIDFCFSYGLIAQQCEELVYGQQQMNIQLPQVLHDITGETGMAILRAIVAGERDAVHLARFRDPRCKSSQDTIAKALSGNWKDEHLLALKQSRELYDFSTQQIAACDAQIQRQFSVMKLRWTPSADELPVPPTPKRRHKHKNSPTIKAQATNIGLTGVDLAAVGGIGDALALTILSEIGTDITKWPTAKHFASWLGLAPHNDISGGKVLHSRILPTNNRAGQAFRQAATAVARSPSAFGAYYRRKRAQNGPKFAQVATAHKIARTVYYLLNIMSSTSTSALLALSKSSANVSLLSCPRKLLGSALPFLRHSLLCLQPNFAVFVSQEVMLDRRLVAANASSLAHHLLLCHHRTVTWVL